MPDKSNAMAEVMVPFHPLKGFNELQGLRGKTVYLEPVKEKHRESLRLLAKDERLWEFTKTLTDSKKPIGATSKEDISPVMALCAMKKVITE